MAAKAKQGEAVLNAVLGDYLDARDNELATPMCLLYQGRPVHRLPPGSDRLCILVHGMACTEDCWSFPETPAEDYGTLLQRDHGVTPLYVRYNTGLPIWKNGQELSALMQSLLESSPATVSEITMIGHSMGGLVIRSACYQGRDLPWVCKVRKAFYLASPHLGSPLEKAGRIVNDLLHAVDDPVVNLIGDVADLRSAAVKDLGDGDILADGRRVPLDDRIEHFEAAGALPGVMGDVLGDGLVRRESATGASAETGQTTVERFEGLHHLALAHDASVYRWISAQHGSETRPASEAPETHPPRRPSRARAYRALLQEAIDHGSTAVQNVHEAIARRPYDLLEQIPAVEAPSRVVRAAHFSVLRTTYAAIRQVNALAGPPPNPESEDVDPR